MPIPPAMHTNSYIIGTDEAVIVDIGSDSMDALNDILSYMRERLGKIRLRSILITHSHHDHSLGAERLASLTGAEVLIHTEEYDRMPDVPQRRALTGEEVLTVGGLHMRAVHTPGHSPGHLCWLLEEEELLFTGDLIVGEGTVVIAPPAGDMRAYLASLEKLKGMELKALCPGHGPVIQSPQEKIQEYIDHRLMRERQVLDGLSQGLTTIAELVERIYVDVPLYLHEFAAMSVRAHLIKLENEGRVASNGESFILR